MTKTCAFLAVVVLAGSPAFVSAQPRPSAGRQNPHETRERLGQVLEQYPPSLRQVLRCDPSLLARPEYLGTYPTLAAYVTQHPEIAHNPVFFLNGGCGGGNVDGRSQMASALESIFVGLEV